MYRWKMTALLGLLLVTMVANSATKNNLLRLKVLDSDSRSVVIDDSGVPKDCDGVNYNAYCRSSKTTQVTNTLLVQEGNQPPMRVSCSVDSKYSRCSTLDIGSSYDARMEKHGITIFYEDYEGKPRKQFYTLVSTDGRPLAVRPAESLTAPPAPVPAPRHTEPTTAISTVASASGTVNCKFTSTPAGADITLDGKYVGSTPSDIALTTGPHVVVFSIPGFVESKRDLTVLPGSALTVNTILGKSPQ
jgi:hypothetical protein